MSTSEKLLDLEHDAWEALCTNGSAAADFDGERLADEAGVADRPGRCGAASQATALVAPGRALQAGRRGDPGAYRGRHG
ncbi:MAG TPA: hypothetical protein VFN21_05715 [Acidimicrobiales bacterium]|nr:hypothetical protein [Acidimicrobiales bacterium]